MMWLGIIIFYLFIGFILIPSKYLPPFDNEEDAYLFTIILVFWPPLSIVMILTILYRLIKFFARMVIWLFNGGLKEKFKEDEKTD